MLNKVLGLRSKLVGFVSNAATLLTALITLTPLIESEPLKNTAYGVIGFFALLGVGREYFLQQDRKDLRYLLENENVDIKLDKMIEAYQHAEADVSRLAQARLVAEENVRKSSHTSQREVHEDLLDEATRTWKKAVETKNNAWQGLEDVRENLAQVTRIAAVVAAREEIVVGRALKQR